MKISSKVFLGFAIIILASVGGFIVHYKLSQEVARNMESVSISETIIRNSSRVHKTIIEMQSSSRGFLLTDNESFLEPYYMGLNEIPALFREQEVLVSTSPTQRKNLDSLEILHQKWTSYANHLIDAKKESYWSQAGREKYKSAFTNRLLKGEGIKLVASMKDKFDEFDKIEYVRREERRAVLKNSIRLANNMDAFILITDTIIAFITGFIIIKTISRRISGMVLLSEDIAKGHFKVIEDHSKDELKRLSNALNIMAIKLNKSFSDLEQKNQELDQFAYAVSHDLKAPLRGMYNIITWIEEDLPDQLSEQLATYHTKLKGRIVRLENLINGLLAYARIGREQHVIEQFNLHELLKNIVDLVIPPQYTVHVYNQISIVKAEKIKLEQVLTNLLSNAVKFQPSSGSTTITVSCKELPDYYEFSVIDKGVGIAPEYHQKIFGMFQTLREKHETESTGMGLAIVKKIIDDQKGNINVISEPGKGSAFVFTWPKHS